MLHRTGLLVVALLMPFGAQAANCDYLVKKAATQEGEALVKSFSQLISCEKSTAESAFDEFMRASKDVGTLVDLSLTAITGELYTPVWHMLEKIPDYSARDEIASGIGAACTANDKVVPFLEGAYFGLRGVQFTGWNRALVSCEDAGLNKWMGEQLLTPPKIAYDEKYNTLIDTYVKRNRAGSLKVLERAATSAAGGGPFNVIVEQMEASVQPESFGGSISAEDRALLEKSLVQVANQVGPEQAAMVADRLYNAGSESAAAGLLPRVYPTRVQGGGQLMYGGASVEACDEEAVIHFAAVTDPSKRWSIVSDLEEPARAFKPRLKCSSDGPWPVLATGEPVEAKGDISEWADSLVSQWEGRGFVVKLKEEKAIALE